METKLIFHPFVYPPHTKGLTNYLCLHGTITNAQTSMLDHSVAIKYARIPEKNILSMCSEVDLL